MPEGSEQSIKNMPEASGVKSPEVDSVTPEVTPEVAPDSASIEKSAEALVDQAPPVVTAAVPQAPIEPANQPAVTAAPVEPVDQVDDVTKTEDMDKQWIEAVEQVIDKNEDLPYEEEEAAEKLSIDYLWKRFKRKIGKDD